MPIYDLKCPQCNKIYTNISLTIKKRNSYKCKSCETSCFVLIRNAPHVNTQEARIGDLSANDKWAREHTITKEESEKISRSLDND